MVTYAVSAVLLVSLVCLAAVVRRRRRRAMSINLGAISQQWLVAHRVENQ